MTHQDLERHVPFYAIGALEKIERQALEAHLLSGCIPCHTRLKEYQSVAMVIPFELTLVPPPRNLKAKIMGTRTLPLSSDETANPSTKPSLEPGEWMNHLFPPSTTSASSFGWGLSMLFLAVLGVLALLSWNSSPQETATAGQVAELQTQAAEAQAKLATLQQQLRERDESFAQTQAELQLRITELTEVKDQLIQREAELNTLKAQLLQQRARPTPIP
ncbi:MAG TPA: hypothetical protein PKD12_12505 [Nitrospira sp.]|nr:hypothetical protein [Nitrospira sp.]